jgi:hypothetical protein
MTSQSSQNAAKRTFLTDSEFEGLFGYQVAEATRMLAQYATATCQVCGGECCPRIRCEFYSNRFDTCPIYEYRPAKCRLYFCEKILENELLGDEARWLINRPAKELSERLKDGWGLGIFIEPPVIVAGKSWLAMLGIEEEVVRIVQSLNNDQASPDEARARLMKLVQQCREHNSLNLHQL